MTAYKLPRPGTWFAVPLLSGDFAHGLVARNYKRTYGVGYFFGPALARPEGIKNLKELRPESAVLVGFFGYLGFKRDSWPILGEQPAWNPAHWPLPRFVQPNEIARSARLITYDESDISVVLSDVEAVDTDRGPEDGMMGHKFLQARLTQLVGGSNSEL
jgi:hypothetical protein